MIDVTDVTWALLRPQQKQTICKNSHLRIQPLTTNLPNL